MRRRSATEGQPPAWPKFARDWLTSEAVLSMPRAARSLYDDLLCHQWLNESLPADPAILARLTGETPESFAELWKHVAPQFEPGEDGRLRNSRLARERKATDEFRAARAAAGARGAAATNGKRAANERQVVRQTSGSADRLPPPLPAANERLSSASASASAPVTEGNSSRSVRAREDSPPASGDPPTGEQTALCAWWVERYRLATTSPTSPQGARYEMNAAEGAKVRELLTRARANGRGADLVREVVERFIAHKVFGQEPPTLGRVLANWNTLVAVSAAQAPPSRPAPEPPDASDVRNAWERRHRRKIPDPHGRPGLVDVVDPYPGYAAAKAELKTAPSATGAA